MAKKQPKASLDKFISKAPKTFGKGTAASESTGVNKNLVADPTKLRVITQAEKDAKEAKERRQRIDVANAVQPYMWSSPKNLAVATSAIDDKLRFSDYPNWFDDSLLNPLRLSSLASGLGQVPLNIQQGNYGQAAWNVAAPVAFGAAETLAAPYIAKATTAGSKVIGQGLRAGRTAIDQNFTQVGRQLAQIEAEGLAKGLSPHEIKMNQMDQVGITSSQREAYVPGVSDLLYKYVKPRGYSGPGETKLAETLKMIKQGGVRYADKPNESVKDWSSYERTGIVHPEREDAWRMYLGKPQRHGTFEMSQTAPIQHPSYTPEQLSGLDLYSIKAPSGRIGIFPGHDPFKPELGTYPASLFDEGFRFLDNPVVTDSYHTIMGGHNKRLSKAGLEYNDIWDLNPKIEPLTLVPNKFRKNFLNNPFFVEKLPGDAGERMTSMEVPIDKFIGKPFMTHGVDQTLTSDEVANSMRSGLLDALRATDLNRSTKLDKMHQMKMELPDMINDINRVHSQQSKNFNDKLIKLYDYPKFKEGGWLDKYNDGGPVQPNYNDYSVSASDDFVGEGYSNVGRNYSPAWGGQFEDGGEIAQTGKRVPFDQWYKTVPKAKNDTINYNLRRAYELAPQKDVDAFVKDPNAHLMTAYENPETGIYEFMKSKHHSTINKELDWYNSKKGTDFRNKYDLDTTGDYYRYVPKEMADGGDLSFVSNPKLRNMLEGYKPGLMNSVGDYRLPEGYAPPFKDPSSEISTSIGGEGGEPAYLIPTFKYGQRLNNPVGEFNMTGQHIGGPFKTVEDVEKFGELRHQYVGDGKTLPSPIATSNMAMGGSMPGAVGFTYARVAGSAPSKGPYGKKTVASAQNGMEMSYYQNGLDFKPKTISKDGSKIIKDDRGQWAHPGKVTQINSNQITMKGVPYPVLGISNTGHTQMMYPNQEYEYIGNNVTEYPMAQNGLYAGKNPKTFGKNTAAAQSTGTVKPGPALLKSKQQLKKEADLAKAEAAKERDRLSKEFAKNQTYLSADTMPVDVRERQRAERELNDRISSYVESAPLTQSLTAMSNPELGKMSAETITEMSPVMQAARVVSTLKDPVNNPYGIGPDSGWIQNTLGTLGAIGDFTDLGGNLIHIPATKLSKYKNVNEVARHLLAGVPPEKTLQRLGSSKELRDARVINEMGNLRNFGKRLDEVMSYGRKEGLSEEQLQKMFPYDYVSPSAPPVPAAPAVPPTPAGIPTRINPEIARLRNQITPSIERAAMSMPEDIANRGDLGEMMQWMADNNRSIRSMDDLAVEGLNAQRDLQNYDPYEFVDPISNTRPGADYDLQQFGRELAAQEEPQYTEPFELDAYDPELPEPPVEQNPVIDDPYSTLTPEERTYMDDLYDDLYARLTPEEIAANQSRISQAQADALADLNTREAAAAARESHMIDDATRQYALESADAVANPNNNNRSLRFPRTGGYRGGFNHNGFIDRYRAAGLTLQEIAEGADSPRAYINPSDRLYAQDILDPSEVVYRRPAPPTPSQVKKMQLKSDIRMGVDQTVHKVKDKIEQVGKNIQDAFEEIPKHEGSVDRKLSSLFAEQEGSKRNIAARIHHAISQMDQSGKVYAGDLNTSHNSYLTQLKNTFKVNKEGVDKFDPRFLGYHRMNSYGYLSNAGFTQQEIASFLNSEIDKLIKGKRLPKNIQRPYVKGREVMLPQYGLLRKKDGGNIDMFEQGGQLTKLDQLTNFTNYNTKQPGGWLDKYQ